MRCAVVTLIKSKLITVCLLIENKHEEKKHRKLQTVHRIQSNLRKQLTVELVTICKHIKHEAKPRTSGGQANMMKTVQAGKNKLLSKTQSTVHYQRQRERPNPAGRQMKLD